MRSYTTVSNHKTNKKQILLGFLISLYNAHSLNYNLILLGDYNLLNFNLNVSKKTFTLIQTSNDYIKKVSIFKR